MADGSSGEASSARGGALAKRAGDDARLLVDVPLAGGEVAKAFDGGPVVEPTRKLPMPDEEAKRLERAGAILPPYPPQWLALIYEESSALRPAIAALQANVDGHGHRLEPRVKLDAPGFRDELASYMTIERMMAHGGGGLRSLDLDTDRFIPTPVDIGIRLEKIRGRMRLELARASAFFSACAPGRGFVALRKELRRDREGIGGAFLGVRRDNYGEPAEYEHLPSVQMRLRPIVADRTGRATTMPVDVPVRSTPVSVDLVTTHRAFRTFVQFGLTTNVYFKEYGDPRTISAQDGRWYESEEHLPQGHLPATEVIYLPCPSQLSAYGVPPWIGATPNVTGLRASEEVNALHFDNNGIPRMLLLVSGGTLKEGAAAKLEDGIKAHVKGRKNYGAMLIVEATPPKESPGARVQIVAQPLKEAIPDDGLFQKYAANMRDIILAQWRLPRFVTGILDDVNRATSEEGREFVETEVYQPMRAEFDEVMNLFLESIGVYFWKFVSNSPVNRDPKTTVEMVKDLATAGGATVNDVRRVMGDVFNEVFPAKTEAWADMPIALAVLSVQNALGAGGGAPPAPGPATASKPGAAPAPAPVAGRRVAKNRDELVRALESMVAAFDAEAGEAHAIEIATAEGDLLVLPMASAAIRALVDAG